MKPQIIASFPNRTFHVPELDFSATPPGRLSSHCASHEEGDFPFLIEAARLAGYELRTPPLRDPCELVLVNGAIGMHEDDGIGVIAITLLQCTNEDYLPGIPELITTHGWVAMNVGDMAVFDSRKTHGWVSRDHCVLAAMAVKKKRRKRVAPQEP